MATSVNWLDQCYRRVYISQHYENWESRTFEKYNVSEMIDVIEKADPSFVLITARTHNGKWFCDVGWGSRFAPLSGTDEVKAFTDHFHNRGVRVVAYVSAMYDKELFDLHEDWRQVSPDGKPVSHHGGSWGQVVCPNSPYREYMVQMVGSLARTHEDLDGIFFDMTFFEEKPCYCAYCRKAFRERYGIEIPSENWDNPDYRKFLDFRTDTNRLFIRDICNAVKRNAPNMSTGVQCQIMMNAHSMTSQTIAAATVSDYLYFDPYIQSGFLLPTVGTRIASTVSRHVPEISLIVRPGNHNDNPNMKPLAHLRNDAFNAIANGGAVQFFDVMWSNGTLQKAMFERVGEVFQDVKAREPYLGGNAKKTVAVFYSEKTRYRYGQRNDTVRPEDAVFAGVSGQIITGGAAVSERYDQHYQGICRALLEEHIHWNPIVRITDEILNGYQVLVLPNAACLSEDETACIRRFVKAGGGLVATGRTSLYDENGCRLDDYALNDVLGLHYDSDTSAYARVYSRFTVPSPLAELQEDGLMTNWGTMQRVTLDGAKPLAYLTYPYTEATPSRYLNIMVNPPAVDTEWPTVTQSQYGKGKVVYFAGEIAKNYLKLSFPELRKIISGAVKMTAHEKLNITLDAPKSVELNVYEQPDQSRLVCHLLNFQPEIGRPVVNGLRESRHIVDEVLPVYDLTLRIAMPCAPKKVTLQPGNRLCANEYKDGTAIVTVERLDQHVMVVIEY